MKKHQILIYISILFILLFVLTGCSNNENKENVTNTNNITGSRISTNVNEQIAENRVSNILQNNSIQNASTEIASYTTTILDKEAGRLTNISITCSTLNNTIVKSGENFSFNKTVGQPTAQKGYQEASIIVDHKKERGIGRRKLSSKFYFI